MEAAPACHPIEYILHTDKVVDTLRAPASTAENRGGGGRAVRAPTRAPKEGTSSAQTPRAQHRQAADPPALIRRKERPTAGDSHYSPRAAHTEVGCEGCGRRGRTAEQCKCNKHPNWNALHATVKSKDSAMAQEIKLLNNGEVRSLPPDGVQWLPADKVWIGGEQLKAWKARITAPYKRSQHTSTAVGNPPDNNRGESIHLGVVRGGTDVYPSVQQGTLASASMYSPTENIVVECLLDTGCLFANFVKADIARRFGSHTQSADKQRLVTLADGSLTSSVGYVNCDVTLTHDETSMKLENVTLRILPGLAFDVILGFPCIRKYNLITNFSFLFSESNLQVHNCTKCRQCLPKVFQQESSPSNGETHSKVLLALPCASALNLLREPCEDPGGSVVEALRSDQPGGHAPVPQGLVCDRKTSDLAPAQLLGC
jgi:hypothetical protein